MSTSESNGETCLRRIRRLLATSAAAMALLACAHQPPREYRTASAEAERHYSAGRYAQSAAAWRRASESSEDPSQQAEALYRAASAEQRAGNLNGAAQLLGRTLALRPKGARAPRAAYDLALIEIELGNTAAGEARLRRVVLDYQESALAGRAFTRLERRRYERGGAELAAEFAAEMLDHTTAPELSEQIGFRRAELLLEQGKLDEARLAFVDVATKFPYPGGAYWDDALWFAADIERRQGRPREALALLNRMLAEVEPAHFQGSYARARYAEAQFRIAEIYRDDLHDGREARRQFERVFREHPTSLLRDDALWQAALIARAGGDPSGACDTVAELARSLPDSRYVACASLLCDRAARSGKPCHNYLRRSVAATLTGDQRSQGAPEGNVEPGSQSSK